MPNLPNMAIFVTALLAGSAAQVDIAAAEPSAAIVEFENPLASSPPLQGYLRQPSGAGPSPAVVLLHGCNGDWRGLDENWGRRVASWGYVTLTVDSFGPRGMVNTCNNSAPVELAFDAYRALGFLAQRPFVDRTRIAVLGFSQGGWITLSSVERGSIERTSPNKFRAAAAFYPPCSGFKDNMTVPVLILAGELDDWTAAEECRKMAAGEDDYGIARRSGQGIPIQLIVYPGAYHAFDMPTIKRPIQYFGHHLEFNQAATEQAATALHEFLNATIGGKDPPQ